MSKDKAIEWAWATGNLRYLLDATQRKMYDAYRGHDGSEFYYFNCARQLGKSYTLCVLALEECLRGENREVKYAAPTQKEARSIIRPQMRRLLEKSPDTVRKSIKFNSMDGVYRFPNGSHLTIGGLDGDNFDRLRGQFAHAIFVDEAGFVDALEDALLNVLLPQTLTTNGRILVASTPADSAGHFSTDLARRCESKGAYSKFTIYDNVRLSAADVQRKLDTYGSPESTRWRREMMCEFVTDTANAVLPSFTDLLAREVVKEFQRPAHYDAYTAIDLGYTDATAMLFAFYDYERAAICIEDEWVQARANSQTVMTALIEKEQKLWGVKQPLLRVTDVDPRFAADLRALHGLEARATRKDNLHAQVNRADVWLQSHRVFIHPRCKTLIRQMHNAVWNKTRTAFKNDEFVAERDTCDFHYDAVAAFVYLVRNVIEHHNPFPPTKYDPTSGQGVWVNPNMVNQDDDTPVDSNFVRSMNGEDMLKELTGYDLVN